ncbi:MAG: tetratricopeptide repeat protein, partial [Myxococcaceae bacterium]
YTSEEQARARAAMPSNPEAARLYAEALGLMRSNASTAARFRLEKAIEREPSFAHARSALAEVYLTLGLDSQARESARRALELASGMAREEQLLFEARLRRIDRDWARAVEIYRALFTFFPDNLGHGLSLARSQSLAGQSRQALETIAALRRLPPPLGDDPRIDLREAHAWAKQGDWRKRLTFCERAIEKGRAMGARLLVADALTGVGEAHYYLGDLERAQQAYGDARRVYEEVGDRKAAIGAAVGLADVLLEQGAFDPAREAYEEAVAFHREVGNVYGVADELNGLAQIHAARGEFARAKEVYAESLQNFEAIEELEGVGNVTSNNGFVLLNEGDLKGAQSAFEEALALFQKVGMRTHEVASWGDLAIAYRRQGRFAEALELSDRALKALREIGDTEKELMYLVEHAELLNALDRREETRSTVAEAMKLAEARGTARLRAALLLQSAELELDEGNAARAREAAEAASRIFETLRLDDSIALAAEVLTRCALAEGRGADAAKSMARAHESSERSEHLTVRTRIGLTSARISAASGRCRDARAQARAVLKQVTNVTDLRFEARLALTRIENTCGGQGPGSLAADAKEAGFLRIARLADEVGRFR